MKNLSKSTKKVFSYVLVILMLFCNDYIDAFSKEIGNYVKNQEDIAETISENEVDIDIEDEYEIGELGEEEYKPSLPAGDTVSTDIGTITWNIDENGLLTVKGEGQPKLEKKRIQNKNGSYVYYFNSDDCWPWTEYQNVITSAEIDLNQFNSAVNMFKNCFYLEKITFGNNFDASNVTNMNSIFSGCFSLKEINLSNFNTSKVTNMSNMFYRCTSLTELDLNSFDTSKVTNMSNMFYRCTSLTKLDLSNFNTSKVTNMSELFIECTSLTELDLSSFDTSKVTNMNEMFRECTSLTKLDISSFNTSNVTSMGHMFYDCTSLKEIDLSNIDTSKVDYAAYMFYGCTSLKELNLSNFDTSNMTDISHMFYNCSSLKNLDLRGFDVLKVENMCYMFSGCTSLTELDLRNFITLSLKDANNLFSKCNSLIKVDISNFYTLNVYSMSNMFRECTSLRELDLSNFDTSNVTSMDSMFYNCKSLKKLDLSNFNTSNVMYMSSMFGECNSLLKLDISSFDTSNITNMSNMFMDCSSLLQLDLSNFDTSNVSNMSSMFCRCNSLKTLNISSFNTSNVIEMNNMFNDCSSLLQLDLSSFDTSNVYYMSNMFYDCSSLKKLDINNFDISNVTSLEKLFAGCKSLTQLNINKLNTSNVSNMSSMFCYCLSLKTLDISNFDTSNIRSTFEMFYGCSSLETLDLSNFDTSNVTEMKDMFYNCSSLETLDLKTFNTSKVKNMEEMFYGCSSLKTLDLSNFDTSNVYDMDRMFSKCSSLETLDLSSFNTSDLMYIKSLFGECSSLKKLNMSNCDMSKLYTDKDDIFLNDNNLEFIITPINLDKEIKLPSNGEWIDENGDILTVLPKNKTKPVVIQKNAEETPEPYKPVLVKTEVSEGEGKIIPGTCYFDLRMPKTFYFIPDKGYNVNKVTVDGEDKGNISSYEFVSENSVSDEHTISVKFISGCVKIETKNAENVIITGDLTVLKNTDANLSFKAKDGYKIIDILVDGKSIGVVDSYKFEKITQNHEIEFKVAKENSIKVICGENGKISPDGNSKVLDGETITYTITPDKKYVVNDVLVDGKSVGAVNSYTFENVTGDHSIEVSFVKNIFTVTFNVNGKNIDSLSKEVTNGSKYGELPTISENGIIFSGWYTGKNGGNKVTAETVVSLTNDITLYAHFGYINLVEKQKLNVKKYFADVENIKSYKVIKSGTGKASVNKKGVLKANKAGMIKIVPCIKDGKKKVSLDDKAITIIITKPEFKVKRLTGSVGETKKISNLLSGLPANSNEVTYTINAGKNSAKQVAVINEETGNIEFLAKGKTKLTVHIVNEDKSERKLSIKIIVK